MKPTIIAKNHLHLVEIIEKELNLNGYLCDLNHIDVSNVKRMNGLFANVPFEGDISEWDVSKVVDMSYMFYGSPFNIDISRWDVSNVKDMNGMFKSSYFNQDLSKWNVSNVETMVGIFSNCKKELIIPYWANYEDNERKKAVNNYFLKNELEKNLPNKNEQNIIKKTKI